MYKKMLIAGVAGLLTLPALAVTAAPAQAANKKICANKAGDTKVIGSGKTCKKKLGSEWSRVSPESLGLVGPAGGHGVSGPQLLPGTNQIVSAPPAPAGDGIGAIDIHHARAFIINYDPNLIYTTSSTTGRAGQVTFWTGGAGDPTEALRGQVTVAGLQKGQFTVLTVSAKTKNGAVASSNVTLQSYPNGTGT